MIGIIKKSTLLIGGLLMLAIFVPSTVSAAPSYSEKKCPNTRVLGYPAWYNGMNCRYKDGEANQIPSVMIKKLNDIWVIVLNVIQWIIITAGYVALFFIIVSGFKYMIARGEPAKIVEAKSTLTNAITGLIIALLSTAIVITVQAAITGSIR